MPSRTVVFEAYLREAANGRNGPWRLVSAILLIILSYAIPIALAVLLMIGGGWSPVDDAESQIGIAIALLSVAWLIPATALALRLVHRRRPAGILGIAGAVSWRQFGRGFLTTMIVMVAATLVGLAFDPRIARGPASIGTWLAFAPLFVILILLQTAAEEVFFRGYLVQTLAARFRGSLVWFGVPAVLFTLMHWNGDVSTMMNLGGLAAIATFAIAATILVVRTGNLGAAMGFHFANNVVALLFFSSSNAFNAVALFVLPPIESPEWSTADATLFAGAQIAAIVLVTILLTHPRSPFGIVGDGATMEVSDAPEPVAAAQDR